MDLSLNLSSILLSLGLSLDLVLTPLKLSLDLISTSPGIGFGASILGLRICVKYSYESIHETLNRL